ncbi:interferon gamma receptor 1 precursor, partial [Clarias magur]
MRAHVRRILDTLTFLTVLTAALSRVTHSVPAPSNVSVTCDSYGVVVEWTATNLSEKADFLLEVKPDIGLFYKTPMQNITKYRRFNISDLLLDTAYNRYFVKVKARDGGQESDFAESQIFSFNHLQTATIVCKLEFPTVTLFPRDGNLFVKFVNPLHVYRDTPALRDLMRTEELKYTLVSGKISKNATCSFEKRECESSVSFPEEQEEYCVNLSGRIRQTLVQGIELYCYSGTLNPGPPVIEIVIPVLVVSLLFLLLSLATAFLVICLSKKIKEKNLSMIPRFL